MRTTKQLIQREQFNFKEMPKKDDVPTRCLVFLQVNHI